MSYHQYYCDKCETEIEIKIYSLDGEWILVEELTPEEIAKLPEDVDPRFLDKETKLKDIPSFVKCPGCGNKKCGKIIHDVVARIKGNSAQNRSRERDFMANGYNKEQAHKFYKESMEASKERMKTMGEVYKPVAVNPQELVKQGQAKKLSDKEKAQKIEIGKKVQQEVAKHRKPK